MKALAIAAVCAGLAATPLAGRAADLVLFSPDGDAVAVLPVDVFAEHAAMMDQMMAQMQALEAASAMDAAWGPPLSGPGGLPAGGMTVVMTRFSDGHSTCSRTVTYEADTHEAGRQGAAPVVKVSQSGAGCGGMVEPAAPVSQPQDRGATPAPDGLKLLKVRYDHHTGPAVRYRG